MIDSEILLSPAICRSARELLQMSKAELASLAQISVVTLRRYEDEGIQPNEYATKQILAALECEGVVFVGAKPTLR